MDLNRDRQVEIQPTDMTFLSTDDGLTRVEFGEHLDQRIAANEFDLASGGELDLIVPGLHTNIANVWVPLRELGIRFVVTRQRYLRYLKPFEYSQLTDHLRGSTLPLHVHVGGDLSVLTEPGLLIDEDNPPPPFEGFNLEVDDMPTSFAGMSIQRFLRSVQHIPAPGTQDH